MKMELTRRSENEIQVKQGDIHYLGLGFWRQWLIPVSHH